MSNNNVLSDRITRRDLAIELLKTGSICISFNPENLREIRGYYLYSNNKKLYVWTKYGKEIYDGLLSDVDDTIFNFGSLFLKIHYPEDCNITPLKSGYFYLLPGKVLTRIFNYY